jgi:methylenetetrahydrofolate--tRNA-(uracil-5-)-methyltransferase
VGFQTHLKWDEQRRVFSMIPGLEQADFVRMGVMHRNTYINSPALLLPTLECKIRPQLFFAGQMTGVEGYVESAAAGLLAGINASRLACEKAPLVFPAETAHGSLFNYITAAGKGNFQPMNVTFGLIPPLQERVRDKKTRNRMLAERALSALDAWQESIVDF